MNVRQILGSVLDAITGPSVTVQVPSLDTSNIHRHSSDQLQPGETMYVESRRVKYRTRYQRPWMPDRYHELYHVCGYYRGALETIPPLFHDTVVYPRLVNGWLRDTNYPHVAAINAFLDRIPLIGDQMGIRA